VVVLCGVLGDPGVLKEGLMIFENEFEKYWFVEEFFY